MVAEVFRRLNGDEALELLDVHSRIPLFKGRKGITKWPVL